MGRPNSASAGSKEDPMLIAVLGVTGAGKSTFINRASGSNLKVGRGLMSCTQSIEYRDVCIDKKWIRLIDTPGFDDTERTDVDILENIAEWLKATYHAGYLLSGIILLQPISNNRVLGSEMRRTRLFKKICGPKCFGNIVIASTMWNELQDQSVGDKRQKERESSAEFWGDMKQLGAKVDQHEDTKESAHRLIRILINNNKKIVLQMQDELAENDGMIHATAAAQQLHDDLGVTSLKENKKLEELSVELKHMREENGNMRADRQALLDQIKALQEKIDRIDGQRERLETSRVRFEDGSVPEWLTALATVGGTLITWAATSGALGPIACVIL